MKKILGISFCAILIVICFANVFAVENVEYDPTLVNPALQNKAKDIWAAIVVIVQILSVACVVFAGLRYMFASADQRADIKQGLVYLTIGAVLVFGATLIINVVTKAANQVIKP